MLRRIQNLLAYRVVFWLYQSLCIPIVVLFYFTYVWGLQIPYVKFDIILTLHRDKLCNIYIIQFIYVQNIYIIYYTIITLNLILWSCVTVTSASPSCSYYCLRETKVMLLGCPSEI